jgi:cobalt-zinc-cadmium efflux system membrane fusion protein
VKREVKVVTVSSDYLRVLDGLKPGERVVTKGAILLKGQDAKGVQS